ncbi:hypothetical protein [Roseimaritima ulvae]|uniref:hypothetical protein n=1 Tax=Roseimaritima ulvae TaxID=980254 RepID=UPI0012FC9BB1|nr:hypothetical protein [Roseimaritima ulvae]
MANDHDGEVSPSSAVPLRIHSAAITEHSGSEQLAGGQAVGEDSIWLLNTRGLTTQACRADLDSPPFEVMRMDECGRTQAASLEEYLLGDGSELYVIYIHGNRMEYSNAIQRGLLVRRQTLRHRCSTDLPVRWLVWSWPSAQEGVLLADVREKAERTDSQGLYLAWLLRELIDRGHRPRLIGFSFGGRVATGALHALGGGALGGRRMPAPHIEGAHVSIGLIAPALGEGWLCGYGYHGQATRNMFELSVLYNRRDAVLKRYPFLDPGSQALGYRGPRGFGPRYDGSKLPVHARNCSGTVGRRHVEVDYYMGTCNAGKSMYQMITKPWP